MANQYDNLLNELWEQIKTKFGNEELEDVQQVKDRATLQAFINNMSAKSYEYTNPTKSKKMKFRAGLQKICARFSEFLECYAGIADIAKGIHPQGGALSYGCLSVLLMVARNKGDREGKIADYLESAKGYLVDLKDWENIYHNEVCDALAKAILEVYRTVFLFSMFSWDYYTSHSIRRWVSTWRPAKYSIQLELDKLEVVIKRVKTETKKIHHAQLNGLKNSVAIIQRERNEEREGEWTQTCTLIRQVLDCPKSCNLNDRIRAFEEELHNLVDDEPDTYNTMEVGNLDMLERLLNFKVWHNNACGGILLMWALNHQDAGPESSLWVSPAIAELALSLRQQNFKVVFHAISDVRESPYTILAIIICEMLEWDQKFWVEQRYQIDIEVRGGEASARGLIRIVNRLLGRWAELHPNEHIYLLLDGIDRWVQKEEDLHSGSWRSVVEVLIDCVQTSKILKICLLGERSSRLSKGIGHIVDLCCIQRRLGEYFWDTGCLQQGNKSDEDN